MGCHISNERIEVYKEARDHLKILTGLLDNV